MKLNTGVGAWAKQHYDKLLASAMLLVLGLSLIYLAVRIGLIRKMQDDHVAMIASFQPEYPVVAPFDPGPYEAALSRLESPFQLPALTNAFFVPEARVWCPECRMPIPYYAEVCPFPFCKAKQPAVREKDPTWDSDGDGIPDLWEIRNKMDPSDPRDAHLDNDGDGFSNIIEFMAEPQTDLTDLTKKHGTGINDPLDYPPPEDLLVVTKIGGDPFALQFRGKVKLPDGSLKFQVNISGQDRTVLAALGDTIQGFTLVDYKEEIVKVQQDGLLKRVDRSILTLKRGDELIPLMMNQLVPYTESVAELMFLLDKSTYSVKPDAIFTMKGKEYKVKDIDTRNTVVVIIRVSDGKEFNVGKAARNVNQGETPQ